MPLNSTPTAPPSSTRARAAGVGRIVVPAVDAGNFDAVRELAHRFGQSYALGIHPLCVDRADDGDLARSTTNWPPARRPAAGRGRRDRHRISSPGCRASARSISTPAARDRAAAPAAGDRPCAPFGRYAAEAPAAPPGCRGIVHAFNGSAQQATVFVDLGFRLGFGGALTFDRALQIRRLATALPLDAIVVETDAPDIPPHWLYRTAAERERRGDGRQARNEPAELPRIAAELAQLRGIDVAEAGGAHVGQRARRAAPAGAAR